MKVQPAYLRVREVAEILRVSRWTVHRMVARGELECLRITPRCHRITVESVDKQKKKMVQL